MIPNYLVIKRCLITNHRSEGKKRIMSNTLLSRIILKKHIARRRGADMPAIIQLSDFHIKMSMGNPMNNKTFMGLIAALKKMNLQEPILVYNGDIIDSNIIRKAIDVSLASSEKAERWNALAYKAYALAEEYFRLLTSELRISNERILICCGNHDANTFAEPMTSIPCPGSCQEILYAEERFKEFNEFCKRILLQKDAVSTYFREINGINFMVVNTNWRNKWSSSSAQQKLCIACDEIKKIIQHNMERLQSTKDNRSKTLNVYVAHAPSTDYCEEALYAYPQNNFNYVYREIDRLFGLKLYGDKHTGSIHSFDYIIGAPLDSEYITCGIHEFDNSGHHHHCSLVFENCEWKVVGSEDHINEILSVSKSSIKAQTLEYLFGVRDTSNLEQKIIEFETVRASEKWDALDRLLRASADIQQPQKVGAGIPVSADDGFINTLTRLVADSHSKVAITLRGEPRVGKSVCMSALYLNLLHRFVSGTFEYLPVYINVESLYPRTMQKKNLSTNKLFKLVSESFRQKYNRGIALAKILNRPACCIIDGLNKYYLFGYPKIEDFIASEIESSADDGYRRFVYCIDVGLSCGLGSTPQDRKKNAEAMLVEVGDTKTQLSEFYRHVALRSIEISKFFIFSDSNNGVRKYICKLISNAHAREVNRMFYLQFYGDRKIDDVTEIKEGFDIYCTYNLLATRLKKWKEQENSYMLMELELFTLCDLLQERLDKSEAISSNEKDKVLSFFYNPKYNKPNDDMALYVLTFMISVISQYIDVYRNAKDNTLFIQYLSEKLISFRVAQSKLSFKPLKAKDDEYKPEQVLENLIKIERITRVGWYIQNVPQKPILESEFIELQNQKMPVETTLIHIYEAYLIGLLYLPTESTSGPSYCKQTILNLILVHDLGESLVGDIIPMYENYNDLRIKEKAFCDNLFLQGTHKNMADLSEYLYLWQEWHENNTTNINVTIAKEIDKIQMLYKMLRLLQSEKINLSKARVKDFWKARNSIQSVEGKQIFNILIAKDEFLNVLRAYDITITPLK